MPRTSKSQSTTAKLAPVHPGEILLEEFLKPQGRFKHLFAPDNEWLLKKVQEEVDAEWEKLKREAKTD